MSRELADIFYGACMRLHEGIDDLYEKCFTDEGDPNYNLDAVSDAVLEYRKSANIELDLIKTALKEYHEQQETRQLD